MADLEVSTREGIDKHPLFHLIPSRTFNELGKVVYRRGTVDEDENGVLKDAMYRHAALLQEVLARGVIEPAIQQILSEHDISLDDFIPLVVNNSFIPKGRELIYVRGLYAGLVGDYLVAVHLLIPQLENSIRYLLQQQNVITSGLDSDLIQDEYTLGKILYLDKLKDVFDEHISGEPINGERIVFELKGLLVERSGSNLRNLSAHGLMTYDDFESSKVIYLWWLIFYLSCFPKMQVMRNKPAE
jgi:hypothetical protein